MDFVTAREKLELIGAVTCSMSLVLIMMCLLPGWIEIREKFGKIAKRSKRKHRAGHRVQEGTQGSPADGDPVEDPQTLEAAA